MFLRSLATAAALLSVTQAVDVQVVYVGKNPANNVTGLKYWPENIKAEPGTMVQFQFWTGNHTITQSSFDKPCTPWTPAANDTTSTAVAIKSGFQPADMTLGDGNIPTYTVMINDTSPLWFYCGQGAHCQGGMSMVINEKPASGKTLAEYKLAAETLGSGNGSGGSGGGNAGDGSNGDNSEGGSGGSAGEGSGDGSGDGTDGEDAPGDIPGNAEEVGNSPGAAATTWPWSSSMLLVVGAAVALI